MGPVGAPECLVVLKEPLAEGRIGQFALWLARLGRVTREEKDHAFVIEGTAAALALEPQKEGEPRVTVRLTPPRSQPHHLVGRIALELAERCNGLIHL